MNDLPFLFSHYLQFSLSTINYRTMTKLFFVLFSLATIVSSAQPFDSGFFDAMKWRMIGPHRGGRTVGAIGIPQRRRKTLRKSISSK